MLELGVLHHHVLLEVHQVHGVDIGSSDVHLAHKFEFCFKIWPKTMYCIHIFPCLWFWCTPPPCYPWRPPWCWNWSSIHILCSFFDICFYFEVWSKNYELQRIYFNLFQVWQLHGVAVQEDLLGYGGNTVRLWGHHNWILHEILGYKHVWYACLSSRVAWKSLFMLWVFKAPPPAIYVSFQSQPN